MAHAFDTATAIRRVAETTWSAHLDPQWNINVVPNGGYSTTPMIRAMLEASGRTDPLSVTTHFYKTCVSDEDASIEAVVLRSGKTLANAAATLAQEGQARSHCVAVLGTLPDADGDRNGNGNGGTDAPTPIDLPPPDKCLRRASDEHNAQGFPIPLADVVDMRIDREMGGGGDAAFGGWIRFADERSPDALALGLFADALPPAILVVNPRAGWVPTLELTVHVRRRPVAGWIRASVRSVDLQDDLLIEDVLLWDESDALVAQARQLAMLLR